MHVIKESHVAPAPAVHMRRIDDFVWASRQMFSASASLGTTARAAGVSIAAPAATKSFCISTTIMAVFFASITSICMTYLRV
jgi:hypothetical protein